MKRVLCYNTFVRKAANWFLAEKLELKSYSVYIVLVPLPKEDTEEGMSGGFCPPNIVVLHKPYNSKERLLILFHELRHYYQYRKKMFENVKYPPIQFPMSDKAYKAYLKLPHEADANKVSEKAFKEYIELFRLFQ